MNCLGIRLPRAALALACVVGFNGLLCAQNVRVEGALPDAPLPAADRIDGLYAAVETRPEPTLLNWSTSSSSDDQAQASQAQTDAQHGEPAPTTTVRPQQQRVFGILPNYNSVSGGGVKYVKPGWRTDFKIANRQNYDYIGIIYGLATSAVAYAQDSHPSLNTENGGNAVYWAYAWRGFVDRTDGVYQGTFFFPALLHQDVRYFAKGEGSIAKRTLHAVDSVVIAHSYSGKPVFNLANLAGKAGTQAVSRTYYPAGSEGFGVLAQKFTYACLRQAGFTVLREFSPDIAVHLRHHKQPQP